MKKQYHKPELGLVELVPDEAVLRACKHANGCRKKKKGKHVGCVPTSVAGS